MSRCDLSSLTLALVLGLTPLPAASTEPTESSVTTRVRAMSFNIRYGTADDGPNHWRLRRELVFATLSAGDYDFIGLQEALPFQLDEIASALPEHEILYRTREQDPAEGEACAILYRADRWQLDRREQGTFWLSETPQVPGSVSWDSSLPRITTWGRFSHLDSGALIYVFNTHFDHRGQQAREQSAELLRRRVAQAADSAPVLVMGDFNAGEQNPAMLALRSTDGTSAPLVDSFRLLHPDAVDVYTANGWGDRGAGEKIDTIFVRKGTDVRRAAILRPRYDGRAPSDHDPVTAELILEVDQIVIEITDLDGCRSCAGGVARSLSQVEGVLRAQLHPTEPRMAVTVAKGTVLAEDTLRAAVRDAGYTAGAIAQPSPAH